MRLAYPVARAVAASSAFPFLLSPLTVKAYGKAGGFEPNDEYSTALQDFHLSPLRYHWARPQMEYLDQRSVQYVHLLDGGLADNIGLRPIERAYAATDGFLFQTARAGRQPMERLVVIAVNAKTDPDEASSLSGRPPGIVDVALKTATVSMDNYSFETVEVMRALGRQQDGLVQMYSDCVRKLGTACPLPKMEPSFKTCVIEVSFDAIADESERRRFRNLRTSFDLPPETVDEVVAMGARLLRQSPHFVSLVRALGGDVPSAPPPGPARCD